MATNEYITLAGKYCERMEWNHDAIPELAECLEDHDKKLAAILQRSLAELPVGNIRTHTPESIPERIGDLVGANAELERELNEQVVCNGKGAEREADMLGKVERLECEIARLREALRAVGDLCTTDHESKERFIARVLLCLPNVQAQR